MLKGIVAALALAASLVEWPYYGGDQGGAKYSPLTDINGSNVTRLRAAWQWSANEKALENFGTRPGVFEATPLMIDNVLYLTTPYNRVVALDADSGKEIWAFDPKAYEDGQPPNGTGFVHRGVAAWRDRARRPRRDGRTRCRSAAVRPRTPSDRRPSARRRCRRPAPPPGCRAC